MMRRGSLRTRRTGCGLLVGACIVTCLLLLVNRVFVAALYVAIVPPKFDYARLRTILQILFMIGLLLPEWWLIDRIIQFLRASLVAIVSPGSDEETS